MSWKISFMFWGNRENWIGWKRPWKLSSVSRVLKKLHWIENTFQGLPYVSRALQKTALTGKRLPRLALCCEGLKKTYVDWKITWKLSSMFWRNRENRIGGGKSLENLALCVEGTEKTALNRERLPRFALFFEGIEKICIDWIMPSKVNFMMWRTWKNLYRLEKFLKN